MSSWIDWDQDCWNRLKIDKDMSIWVLWVHGYPAGIPRNKKIQQPLPPTLLTLKCGQLHQSAYIHEFLDLTEFQLPTIKNHWNIENWNRKRYTGTLPATLGLTVTLVNEIKTCQNRNMTPLSLLVTLIAPTKTLHYVIASVIWSFKELLPKQPARFSWRPTMVEKK